MNHTNEGQLQAYLDGELDGESRLAVDEHLSGCLPCRGEMRELREMSAELAGALLLLDGAALPEAGTHTVGFPRQRAPRVWTRRASALPRAAALVFLVAGAASAMIPGSPLYDALRGEPEPVEVAAAPEPAVTTTMAAPAESAQGARAAAPEAGVSIEPVDGAVTVVVRDADPQLRIRALLSESGRAGVYATGPASAARFDTGPGRIEVAGTGAGELRIEIPREARSATVVVNGEDYLVKQGDQLQLTAAAGGKAGAEVLFTP